MSTSHLYSLRVEKRRERLEWLGDIVLEEIIVRLIARQALAALDWEEEEEERRKKAKEWADREEAGRGHRVSAATSDGAAGRTMINRTDAQGGLGVPPALRPLSWRLDFATRLAVSNANLRVVYENQLVGLMGFVGLEEDQFLLGLSGVGAGGAGDGGGGGKRKRCRSSSFSGSGFPAGISPSAKKVKTGKEKKMRCRSSSFGSAADAMGASPASATTRVNKRDKRMPDMVEAAIGEAFEASLDLGEWEGGGGGCSVAEVMSSSGPQRFAGGHRAALVDRLLSTALNTEYFLSGLQEPRAAREGGGDRRTHSEEAEGPYTYDDDFVSSSGFDNSFGALNSSSSSSDEEGGDESEGGGGKRTNQEESVGQEKGETSVAQGVRDTDGGEDAAAAADEIDRSESIAAGREGVLRLYGAVLLKFRTSVFLFCSAEAAKRGGGQNDTGDGNGDKAAESNKHGPFELTLRRQGVMSAENLEAVAAHLQSLQDDGAGGPGRRNVGAANVPAATEGAPAAPAPAGTRQRARDWMRVEVGRAALCGGGGDAGLGVAFSTRVAALLLSRSGERGGPPKTEGGGGRGPPGIEERSGPVVGAWTGARAAAMAVAEAQFGRDPWPEEYLPRASQQAARVFLPEGASRKGASAAAGDARPCRTPSPSPVPTADGSRNAAAAAPGKKRKRDGGEEELFRVPPQYVGLLGQLPRDSRHLLARLGHQGYVKVLEDLLRGFLGVPNAAAPAEAASAAATTAEVVVPPAAADSVPDTGVSGDNVDLAVSPDRIPGSSPRGDARGPGTPGADDPGQDQPQDPWRALQAGRPHPSLSGLVEPPELASTGAKRMVLPMPNPFYRRVLHALCRVHGLVSCGGETHRLLEAAGGKEDGRGRTATGYRTVEVTRGDGGGGGGWGGVKRPGDRRGGVDGGKVMPLVPVEILLAER